MRPIRWSRPPAARRPWSGRAPWRGWPSTARVAAAHHAEVARLDAHQRLVGVGLVGVVEPVGIRLGVGQRSQVRDRLLVRGHGDATAGSWFEPTCGRGQASGVSFGQQSGPPASAKQLSYLLSLVKKAGFEGFRDARHPLGLTQRQAGGKFTGKEASALIDRLLGGEADGDEDELDRGSGRCSRGAGGRCAGHPAGVVGARHAGRGAGRRARAAGLDRRAALRPEPWPEPDRPGEMPRAGWQDGRMDLGLSGKRAAVAAASAGPGLRLGRGAGRRRASRW